MENELSPGICPDCGLPKAEHPATNELHPATTLDDYRQAIGAAVLLVLDHQQAHHIGKLDETGASGLVFIKCSDPALQQVAHVNVALSQALPPKTEVLCGICMVLIAEVLCHEHPQHPQGVPSASQSIQN